MYIAQLRLAQSVAPPGPRWGQPAGDWDILHSCSMHMGLGPIFQLIKVTQKQG